MAITNKEWQVLLNILGAVETGGQVYGQRDYSDYTEAYTNSSAENSITIGAFQEFNSLAKGLLQDIKNQYPAVFAKYDNAGIADDLKRANWNGYNPSKSSAKAKAIVNIISSPEGKKVQDDRFIAQMKEHVVYGQKLGVTDTAALFEICNICHQGGSGAASRIIAKTAKPYTLDHIYQALCTDNVPNQVGTFTNRQKLVYNWLKQYMPKNEKELSTVAQEVVYDINPGTSADEILNIMRSWLGLSKANQTHHQIIDIYNSYLPHPRGYAVTYYDDYCATTVSAAFIRAKAVDLIGGIECGVDRFIEDCFKPKGIWIEDESRNLPQKGDIICFNWDSNQPSSDNTGFADHIGIVESVSGGIITTIEGNTSGGVVARKQYPTNYGFIRGYARPRYNQATTTATMNNQPVQKPVSTPKEEQTASSTAPSKVRKFYGIVIADVLNIRTWPGTSNPRLKSYPQLPYGTRVEVCDTVNDTSGNPWYYIRINNSIYGFASAEYIQKT